MEFCHLCPMETHGLFDRNTTREGRPRWRLVPEGQCREVDVGAARVKLVKHKTVGKTPSADKEVWDVLESDDENLREFLAKGAVFIAEESDGEEKVAPSVALGTKSRPSTGPTYPCPAGCGRTFNHPPAAAIHGKTCPGAKKDPALPAPAPPPPPAPGGA